MDQETGKIAVEGASLFVTPGLLGIKAVGPVAMDATTLYRAVTEAELKQIQVTGSFEAGVNSLGGKCFAETIERAREWGNLMNGKGTSTILEVQLLRSQASQLMRLERLDGIGPAVYGELEQLRVAAIRALGK